RAGERARACRHPRRGARGVARRRAGERDPRAGRDAGGRRLAPGHPIRRARQLASPSQRRPSGEPARRGADGGLPLRRRPPRGGRVQAALDQVDERLRPGSPATARFALGSVVSALLVFWTLFTAQLATPLVPGLIALIRPSPAALAAAGATAMGQAGLGLAWSGWGRAAWAVGGGFPAGWSLATH